MALYNINGKEIYINKKLKNFWDRTSLQVMKKTNNDRVYIVDGRERSGKSTFAIQQMAYLEPSLFNDPERFASRICFTPDEFSLACRQVKNGVIIYDEAFRGLSSRGAMSNINKKLIQTLQEMGQNNNIVFIVLPSFFLLDIYPAMLRSDGLFHIYMNKKNRRRSWKGYNKNAKNQTHLIGIRKGWTYPIPTVFKDNFAPAFPGGELFEDAYLNKKAISFKETEKKENKDEDAQRTIDKLCEICLNETEEQMEAIKLMKSKYNILVSRFRMGKVYDRMALDRLKVLQVVS